MPLRGTPVCLKCKTKESSMWTNAENLGAICLNCVNETKLNLKMEVEDEDEENTKQTKRKPRMTRSYKTRLHPTATSKGSNFKTKGRRGLTKRTPFKGPSATATTVTDSYVFCKGTYFQIGDIVSMKDVEGDVYYAQITGLLTDQYCDKSAVVNWLLPTQESPPPNKSFDPATYVVGLEEVLPRRLECMTFVMHAPSDYYKSKTTPYPSMYAPPQPGYIWSTMETVQKFFGAGVGYDYTAFRQLNNSNRESNETKCKSNDNEPIVIEDDEVEKIKEDDKVVENVDIIKECKGIEVLK